MDKISFQSTIRPVSSQQFRDAVVSYGKKNFIAYPWTVKESVISDRLYTTGVEDCSFFALTDGVKVLGMHLCPTMEANSAFSRIVDFIKENICLNDSNLQGLILGGRKYSEDNVSYRLFENLENLFKKYKIPYSKFKGGKELNDVAYNSTKDEFLISTSYVQSKGIKDNYMAEDVFEEIFEEVSLSQEDEISL